MYNFFRQPIASVLCLCALGGCSDKRPAANDTPPVITTAAPAAAPVRERAAEPAVTAPAATKRVRTAELVCDDRKIVLEATCSDLYGPRMLACSQQTLSVSDKVSGKQMSTRRFEPQQADDSEPPLVEEKVGTLSCSRTSNGERYIIASMFNGGNCDNCEWHDVYDWDGKLVGSDRDRSPPGELARILRETGTQAKGSINHQELDAFYSEETK